MNTISVYTQTDMNNLCTILNRNGYSATAYSIVSTTENTCCGKQWRIDYYDPKDVVANAYSEENVLPKESEKKEEEIKKLKSDIKLMKEVIVALAKITVNAGFNCTYPEENKFYDLVSKMSKGG